MLAWFLLQQSSSTSLAQTLLPRHAKLFPTNEEYDANILDPRTMYGSPYGGFSRATRSRLASLPLKLPDEVIDDTSSSTSSADDYSSAAEYYEISDHLGRWYACRVFDETELEYGSLKDSLFDTPTFRFTVQVEDSGDAKDVGERVARAIGNHPNEEVLEEFLGTQDIVGPSPPPQAAPKAKTWGEVVEDEFNYIEIERRIDVLEGLCVQRRFHYFTYEWCYEGQIHRFHLTRHREDVNYPRIQLQHVTNLGYSKSKKIEIPMEDSEDQNEENNEDEQFEDTIGSESYSIENDPMGVVHEKFTGGDRCTPDSKKAKTKVHMRCCSPENTLKHKSSFLLHGVPHDIPLASIAAFWEDPDKECRFHLDVCTPILCQDTDVYDYYERIELLGIDDTIRWPKAQQVAMTVKRPAKIEFLSITEILDETLGSTCLYSAKDGWWTYEYCHKKYVRQFNGVTKKVQKDPSDETQYLSGFFNPKNEVSPLDEWKHVVNGTDILEYGGFTRERGGNGAYFEMEYNEGEMCLLAEDVNDEGFAAIERSCSVRLSCDSEFSVTVREDSTCHYVVEVTVPTLCDHVLFKPAMTKKRVVKCLPIDGQSDQQ